MMAARLGGCIPLPPARMPVGLDVNKLSESTLVNYLADCKVPVAIISKYKPMK